MKKIKNLLAGAFCMMFAVMTFAQQGTIILEITEAEGEGQAAQFAEMMIGNQTKVYFDGDKALVNMNMMGGMVKIDILSDKKEGMDMLFDAMGQKIWVEQSVAEIEKDKMNAEEMDIEYDKSDTKTIAGYDCYKMTATIEGDDADQVIEAYITEDIKIDAQVMQGVDMSQFAGFPLEYNIDAGPMKMTITTKEYMKEVDASKFELSTGGFQKISMDEFKSMMAGFGF